MIKRIASLIVAIIGLFAAYAGDGLAGILCAGFYLLLPLACIWYSDEVGPHHDPADTKQSTHPSLSQIVAFGGWILLSIPLIIGIIRVIDKQ